MSLQLTLFLRGKYTEKNEDDLLVFDSETYNHLNDLNYGDGLFIPVEYIGSSNFARELLETLGFFSDDYINLVFSLNNKGSVQEINDSLDNAISILLEREYMTDEECCAMKNLIHNDFELLIHADC